MGENITPQYYNQCSGCVSKFYRNSCYSNADCNPDWEGGIVPTINLFGIESPGLTSSMAIGEYVKSMASFN